MRVESLEYIVTVAETKSVSRAARMLNVQQTTLSSAIKVVEDELGYSLFTRSHHGVDLTVKGEKFLPIAKNLLIEYRKMFEVDKVVQNPINLYVNHYLFNSFLNDIYVPNFSLFSKAGINVYKLKPESFWSYEQERYGERKVGLDQSETGALSFRVLDATNRNYKVLPLGKHQTGFYAYISTQNPLSKKERIKLSSIKVLPIIVGNHSSWELAKFAPEQKNTINLEGQDFYQLMRLVNQNAAVVIYASRQVLPILRGGPGLENVTIRPVEVENCTLPVYQECLIFREDFVFSEPEQRVIDLIVNLYSGDLGQPDFLMLQ